MMCAYLCHVCAGERALLTPAKRAANVVAVGPVTLLAISRVRFEQVMGTGLQVGIFAVWKGVYCLVQRQRHWQSKWVKGRALL